MIPSNCRFSSFLTLILSLILMVSITLISNIHSCSSYSLITLSNKHTITRDRRHNNTRRFPRNSASSQPTIRLFSSPFDWANFQTDDPDQDYDTTIQQKQKRTDSYIEYANENDTQEYKAQVGNQIAPPPMTYQGPPIFVPTSSILPFTEDNVQGVLAACRMEIGTMFGYTAENRGVGITGSVDLVDFDGPIVVLSLQGRFWHQRTTVLERIKKYIMGRIPEVMDVIVQDESELDDDNST